MSSSATLIYFTKVVVTTRREPAAGKIDLLWVSAGKSSPVAQASLDASFSQLEELFNHF